MHRLLLLTALTLGLPLHADEISMSSLLTRMTDYDAAARWPQPEFVCREFSSHDPVKIAPDQPGWLANNDHTNFIRTEENAGRQERVMMDEDGPGSIARFWITTTENKKGVIRIYLDGATEPVLTFQAYDLQKGGLPFTAPLLQAHPGYRADGNGGSTLMLPIPYAKHCKVTWQEEGQGPRYYQIEALTYPAGTEVKTFSRKELELARTQIEKTGSTLLKPPSPSGETAAPGETSPIAAHGKRELSLPPGPRAVKQIELKVPAAEPREMERTLRSLIVVMHCDGENAIWCPAGDFFGSGVGLNELHNWYRTVSKDGSLVCRWTMPYEKTATLSLFNLSDRPVQAKLSAITEPWQWDARSMHFHAVWHSESGLKTPPDRDWNYVTITGRGIYMGDTLSLYNPVATWYGEGDEKIRCDDQARPSHIGTGTEDYYDYSFAPGGIMQTPFANQTRIDQPMTQGQNAMTRTRNLDVIPFHRSLDFQMELIPWKPTTLIYSATTYWYAFPGATSNVQPQPEQATAAIPTLQDAIEASTPKHFPGAVECEALKVTSQTPGRSVRVQDMSPWGVERWSGGAHLLGAFQAPGDFLEVDVPAGSNLKRKLILHATQAPDYGVLRISVNGQKIAQEFDGYAPDVRPSTAIDLGTFLPRDGAFRVRFEVTGANPAATGLKYLLGLDCFTLENP